MSASTEALRRAALAVVMPGFVGTRMPGWLGSRLDEGLAGVWIFGHNIEDPTQARDLTASMHARAPRALVASDEEGGTVTRIEHQLGSSWPGHAALGRVDDVGLTRAVAAELGRYAVSCGVDLVAAPDADVNSEETNPVIGVRSFGADTALVTRHTRAFVEGLGEAGVLSCAKHFPGHGATTQDSHVDLPRVDAAQEVIRQRDLPPFAAAVAAGVDVLMTAHVVYGAWATTPATLTPELTVLARQELGFSGVICTDALDMAAIDEVVGRHRGAVQALAAGVDLICLGNPAFPRGYDAQTDLDGVVGAIVTAVQRGELTGERLGEAGKRVHALAARRDRRRAEAIAGRPVHRPRHGAADGDRPSHGAAGARAAAAAVEVHGTLPQRWERPMLVVAPGSANIAAGAGGDVALRTIASSWPDVTVGTSTEQALTHDGDLVVVTDDRTDGAAGAQLLGRAATLVHLGLTTPQTHRLPDRCPVIRTGGGGRAAGRAAAMVLWGNRS